MYKIAHISDTHIRNLKYHEEYREVFKHLYQVLRQEKPDYIVHCGDIAHTKTQLSPEYFAMASEFLDGMAAIAPLIVILGNHDGNLKNGDREDAISPIVRALNNPNITLLKDSGEYSPIIGLNFNVLSVFDRDRWIKPSNPSAVNIALYHGSISGCLTSTGWAMTHGEDEVSIFTDHDYAMLGDIHKTQALDREKRVWYAGSTVQQNFGESPRKGFLMWEIEDKDNHKVKFFPLINPRPFMTVTLNKDGSLPDKHIPRNSRLRIVSRTNIDVSRLRHVTELAQARWSPHTVTFHNRNESVDAKQNFSNTVRENMRDTSVQEKYIREYLKDYNLDEEVMAQVLEYNSNYNQKAEQSEEVSRNVVWKIKDLEWSNLFNYGEKNKVSFENLQGLVGIFGRNYSGKSSIIDSALFTLFNGTSKGERKNVHVVNQNKQAAMGKMTIQVGDKTYQVCRNINKYEKNLKGKTTIEAKVDLDFTCLTTDESLNGTTRNKTDANICKHFGTMDDFFLTSMASQLDSLSFIKEGSTKRKEILAKFLDLDFFEKKFKYAKADAADLQAVLKRFKSRDIPSELDKKEGELSEIFEEIQKQTEACEYLSIALDKLREEMSVLDEQIEQIPAEIIDIHQVKKDIKSKEQQIKSVLQQNINLYDNIARGRINIDDIDTILTNTNIDELKSQQEEWNIMSQKRSKVQGQYNTTNAKLQNNQKKLKLLDDIPCGEKFPNCKFICDAHKAKKNVGGLSREIAKFNETLAEVDTWLGNIKISALKGSIEEYETLKNNRVVLNNSIQSASLTIERNKASIQKLKSNILDLQEKETLYEENREVIENLGTLIREKKSIEKLIKSKTQQSQNCQDALQELYIEQGATKQTIENLLDSKKEVEDIEKEWVAYDLFMRCMHPNGIPYDIIKKKLPVINGEIAKVLANIVDFEVSFENNDKKLDINIKHPNYDARPLSMASGAEKTLASMAIRLALISITNLPKSELFILDEPATALDHEHMEGFIRLLQMIKNQFKTVILISHLDSLKDVVDMTIDIEKVDGFAKVRI
jgi:DNA repair exonuclease SbcCD ATPase subunit/DNA repair exonuclease SbcCD nuclease subunit